MWFSLAFLLLALGGEAQAQCLPSGDERPINQALSEGGEGATVSLCPGSVHHLQAPIRFTAPRQTLTTHGDAVGHDRAMIIVEGEDQSVAIYADCPGCDDLTLSNLIVDGNRPRMLRIPKGEALIEMGNAEGHTVTGCRLYEPRGWSALHIREGDRRHCRRAHIADNVIGPCGEEWDEEYDGFVEKEPIWGNPRADGISLACMESVVERNTVFDTTDGAIVIFGSRGSQVHDNHIYSRTRVVLGGINLVDYDPWEGDYTDVVVRNNVLMAPSGFLKVGIVVGPSSWSDDTETSVHGGTVVDNTFLGERFGYAIVVSSASDFIVDRNVVQEGSQFIGVPGVTCPTAPENSPPQAFLINRGSARGTFQSEFVNGEVQHIICINPPPYRSKPYTPWRLRDAPEVIAARTAAEAEANPSSKLSERVADSLVMYQRGLLEALERISNMTAEYEALHATTPTRDSPKQGQGQAPGQGERRSATDDRLAALEQGDKDLRAELAKLTRAVASLSGNVGEQADGRGSLLESVYDTLRRRAGADVLGRERGSVADGGARRGHRKSGHGDGRGLAGTQEEGKSSVGAGAMSVGVVLSLGAVLALALAVLRRWRRANATKGLKSR